MRTLIFSCILLLSACASTSQQYEPFVFSSQFDEEAISWSTIDGGAVIKGKNSSP